MAYTSVKLSVAGLLAVNLIGHAGTVWSATSNSEDPLLDRGRYLAQVAGCNDCHTSGYLMSGGKVPESDWLKGDSFGWRGPWGTTYAPNLRLFLQGMSEDQWVETARNLKRRPPMPWYTVNIMHEDDLRALYRFVVSLGDPGEPAPAFLPPGEEPTTPYALFPSPPEQK
jgi:mono/diheme cytochrome c family protein